MQALLAPRVVHVAQSGFRVWGFGVWGFGFRFWGLGLGYSPKWSLLQLLVILGATIRGLKVLGVPRALRALRVLKALKVLGLLGVLSV